MGVLSPKNIRTVASIHFLSFCHFPYLWHLPHSYGFTWSPKPCHLLVLETSLSLLVICPVTTHAKIQQFIPLGTLNIPQIYFDCSEKVCYS